MIDQLVQQTYGSALDINKLLKRVGQMESKRRVFLTKWQQIQDQLAPNTREYNGLPRIARGAATERIANHCSAINGLINKVISNITSQIMDPLVKWLSLTTKNTLTRLTDGNAISLGDNAVVKRWLSDCTEACYDLFNDPSSNFYPANFPFFNDWYTIGTAARHITLRQDTGDIWYNCISMNDVCIDVGAYGEINCQARNYNLTAEQAFELWGEGIGTMQMQLLQKPEGQTRKFQYVELCMKTPPEIQAGNPFAVAPYLSIIINKEQKSIVSIAPEMSFPYIVARFAVEPGDIYGKSLVWQSMPDIKRGNFISKRNLMQIDYNSAPALLASDALGVNVSQLTPGGIVNGLDSNGRPTIQPLQMGTDLPMAMQFYERTLMELTDELLATDIIPQDSNGALSPTEVIRREIQRNNRMRPLLVKLEHDDLRPTIKRTLQLMQQKGDLPGFPYDSLGLAPEQLPDPVDMINISFSGQMANMRRMQDAQNINNLFGIMAQFAQADPNIMQMINLPAATRELAEIFNVPNGIIKTDEELIAEAEAMQQQQQAQEAEVQEQQDLQKRMIEGQMEKEGIAETPEDLL